MALDWYSDPKATAAPDWSKNDILEVHLLAEYFTATPTHPAPSYDAP
jgi:hypothetical protein